MNIEDQVRLHLLTSTSITGITSNISPGYTNENLSLPAITYTSLSGENIRHLRGGSDIANAAFQYDCWSNKYSECQALSEAIRNLLDGYYGVMGAAFIHEISVGRPLMDVSPPQTGNALGTFKLGIEVNIWFAQSVPTLA